MKAPIEGMKAQPFGEDYMVGAWLSLVAVTAEQPGALEEFKADSGFDLLTVLRAKGLAAMIESATGHDRAVIVAFCDWVTKNVWGEAE